MKIEELKAEAPIKEITLVIKKVNEVMQTNNPEVKTQLLVGSDGVNQVNITLWNDQTNTIKEGDTIKITNGYCQEYKEELNVSSGKFGALEVITE